MILKKVLMTFLKTDEASKIIWLDYCGYHLCDNQMDLTYPQSLFLYKGRFELYRQMNEVKG